MNKIPVEGIEEVINGVLALKAVDILSYDGATVHCADCLQAYSLITGVAKKQEDITIGDILLAMTKAHQPYFIEHKRTSGKGEESVFITLKKAMENLCEILMGPLRDLPAEAVENKSLMYQLTDSVHFISTSPVPADLIETNELLTRYNLTAHPELLTFLGFLDLDMNDYMFVASEMAGFADHHYPLLRKNVFTFLVASYAECQAHRSDLLNRSTKRYYCKISRHILEPLMKLTVKLSGGTPQKSYSHELPEKYGGYGEYLLENFRTEDFQPDFQIRLIWKNIKSINYSFLDPWQDRKVEVRVPYDTSDEKIVRFLRRKAPEIHEHFEKGKIHEQTLAETKPISKDERLKIMSMAQKEIPLRCQHFASIMGVTYKGIEFDWSKKAYGSCSLEGILTFNYCLMLAPAEEMDYVIVHELCHLLQFDHSKAFWDEVRKYYPTYKTQDQWEKENGDILRKRAGLS